LYEVCPQAFLPPPPSGAKGPTNEVKHFSAVFLITQFPPVTSLYYAKLLLAPYSWNTFRRMLLPQCDKFHTHSKQQEESWFHIFFGSRWRILDRMVAGVPPIANSICFSFLKECNFYLLFFFFWHYSPWWTLATSKIVLYCSRLWLYISNSLLPCSLDLPQLTQATKICFFQHVKCLTVYVKLAFWKDPALAF
jgi:hypothetical protein